MGSGSISTYEKFLSLFNKLERHLKIETDTTDYRTFMNKLRQSKNPVVKISKNRELIEVSANLRNIIVHNNDLKLALPTEEFLVTFETLVNEVMNPKQVKDVMRRTSELSYCSLGDTIKTGYQMMLENNISNIPIIENRVLVGVFAESSLFLLAENNTQELCVDLDNTKFSEIAEKLYVSEHPSLRYPYVSRKMNVYEALDRFLSLGFKDEKRTELLLVTNNGKSHEELLGIVSPYDLLKLILD